MNCRRGGEVTTPLTAPRGTDDQGLPRATPDPKAGGNLDGIVTATMTPDSRRASAASEGSLVLCDKHGLNHNPHICKGLLGWETRLAYDVQMSIYA